MVPNKDFFVASTIMSAFKRVIKQGTKWLNALKHQLQSKRHLNKRVAGSNPWGTQYKIKPPYSWLAQRLDEMALKSVGPRNIKSNL